MKFHEILPVICHCIGKKIQHHKQPHVIMSNFVVILNVFTVGTTGDTAMATLVSSIQQTSILLPRIPFLQTSNVCLAWKLTLLVHHPLDCMARIFRLSTFFLAATKQLNEWYFLSVCHHLEKGKEEWSPLQYHIKSLHIISRHYKKSLLRSQLYHGYEELSTDTNYPIWRRQEKISKYAVQLASWQLR